MLVLTGSLTADRVIQAKQNKQCLSVFPSLNGNISYIHGNRIKRSSFWCSFSKSKHIFCKKLIYMSSLTHMYQNGKISVDHCRCFIQKVEYQHYDIIYKCNCPWQCVEWPSSHEQVPDGKTGAPTSGNSDANEGFVGFPSKY